MDTLVDYLKRGKTLDEFLEQFPTGRREKAVSILEIARQGVTARRFAGEALADGDLGFRTCTLRGRDRPLLSRYLQEQQQTYG